MIQIANGRCRRSFGVFAAFDLDQGNANGSLPRLAGNKGHIALEGNCAFDCGWLELCRAFICRPLDVTRAGTPKAGDPGFHPRRGRLLLRQRPAAR